jgi:hypothetical protein
MPYTPDATDATQPVGTVKASTASAEFRALKTRVNSLAAGTLPPSSTVAGVTKRQTVLFSSVDANGLPNFLTAGTGLAVNVLGASTPVRIASANSVTDLVSSISTDVTGAFTLPASTRSYLYADCVNATSVTWGNTKAPPEYGYSYPKNRGSLLNFEGTVASTSMIDAFGNTWVSSGTGPKLQSDQVKFGTTALGGSGASNALNGTNEYLYSDAFFDVADSSFTIRAQVYPTAFGITRGIFCFTNNTGFGIRCGFTSSGHLIWWISLDGSTEVVSGATSSGTFALNNWHEVKITWDAVAGLYSLFVNGTSVLTYSSTTPISFGQNVWPGRVCIGNLNPSTTANLFQGYIDCFEILPYCDNSTTALTAASDISTAGYASDFFSIPEMKMYRVSGASTTAGTPPSLTQVNRVYLGQADSGASSITTVVNYALMGRYRSGYISRTNGNNYSYSHNLGMTAENYLMTGWAIDPRSRAKLPLFTDSSIDTTFDYNITLGAKPNSRLEAYYITGNLLVLNTKDYTNTQRGPSTAPVLIIVERNW